MKIEVINIGYGYDADRKSAAYYIGRGSPLGNPWSHRPSKYTVHVAATREEAIEQYAKWIQERIQAPFSPQARAIDECAKKLVKDGTLLLGCFCLPWPCHGEVLAKIILERAEKLKAIFDQIFPA